MTRERNANAKGNEMIQDREFRLLKERIVERGPTENSRATTGQCHALGRHGIFATPNTHTYFQARELLAEVGDQPTVAQKRFAASLGIAIEGMTKAEVGQKIDGAVKAREEARQPAAPRVAAKVHVKKTGIRRHSKDGIVRELSARGCTAEVIAAALEHAGLMRAEFALTVNRRWLETKMQTAGKRAVLTLDDLAALGIGGAQ